MPGDCASPRSPAEVGWMALDPAIRSGTNSRIVGGRLEYLIMMRVPLSEVPSLGMNALANPSVTRVVPKAVPAEKRPAMFKVCGTGEPVEEINADVSDDNRPLA